MEVTMSDGTTVTKENPNSSLHKTLVILSVVMLGIMTSVAIAGYYYGVKIGPTDLYVSTLVLMVLVAYIFLSLKQVDANQLAGTFAYGRPLVYHEPGLHYVPFLLMQIRVELGTVQQFQSPGEPEEVFKGHDKEDLPDGMVRPIRVLTAAKAKDLMGVETVDGDHLNSRMTLVVNFFTRFRITDIFDFVQNYGSVTELKKQVRDTGESELAEIASVNTPATFNARLEETNENLAGKVKDCYQLAGAEFINMRLIAIDVSHEVSEALAQVVEANAKAEKTVIDAEAAKKSATLAGQGAAAAKLSDLTAEAKGLKKRMDALGVGGDAILAAETVQGLSKQSVIIAGAEGGMRDLMAIAVGAQRSLTNNKPAEEGAES